MNFKAVISCVALLALPVFANASVINFGTPVGYSPQDVSGSTTVSVDQQTISMEGNIWSAFAGSYEITTNTVISFEFRSDSVGEIHGIGFDDDTMFDGMSTSGDFFQVAGTQTSFGNQDFNTYSNSGLWEVFTINVGDFLTGTFNYLVFMNDADSVTDISSQYRLVSITETSVNDVNEAPFMVALTMLFGAVLFRKVKS